MTSRKIRVSEWIGRKTTMKQNITLSIEKNLIKKAKILSAKKTDIDKSDLKSRDGKNLS